LKERQVVRCLQLPLSVSLEQVTEAIVRFSAHDGFDRKRLAVIGWSEAPEPPVTSEHADFYLLFWNDLGRRRKGTTTCWVDRFLG
jgi:hypothetical protein